MIPSYINLYKTGELYERVEKAKNLMERECMLCPHLCRVDRRKGKGICKAGINPIISDYGPHFGEEKPLVGRRGSGTIFFAYCNMKCVYCQNYEISWHGRGKEISIQRLSAIMLELQNMGCHNINFVTPTHFVPAILESLNMAIKEGLDLPLVYNCGGYERIETLQLLDGIIDIYMPDFKYNDSEIAKKYSGVPDYPEKIKLALKEMYRQTGDLLTDDNGVAVKGLLIRHLVLPNNLSGTKEIMRFIAEELSPKVFVNVMRQYYPSYRAHEFRAISRRITEREYREALQLARESGLLELD